ncbi:MAG TPA: condensation domain-containing protein [Actinophytocola sp.]|nr:condensation domain-containing protein [Actinophytocola sp.]
MNEVLTVRASHAQQQMWFVEQMVPGEPVHNISFERRYAGHLDPATLRAAVADVVARHESLRTRFVARDTTLWQVVTAPPDEPPVEFTDLSGAGDPRAAFRELCARAGTAVFDLGRAPLLRLLHVRLGPDVDGLVLVLHHAIADAISTEILVRDLTAAYEHRLAGAAPDWLELPVQYADFTAWQEERAGGPAVRQDLEHWRAALADLSTLDLTRGRPRPERLSQRGRHREFTLDADVVSALEALVRTERATTFMGLLAAYAATLGRVFGSEDVAVASPVAGRPLPELRDVIGMFVDQVVLRLDLSEGPTFRELLRAARRVVGDAHDHDSVTFDQIVAAVAPERVAGMTPLAQAAINLQPSVPPRPPAGRMPRATDASQIDTGTATHDLLLDLVPAQAREPFTGTVRHRADVVDDAAAGLVCEVFPRLLRAALAEPDRPLWTLQDLWHEPDPAAPVDVPDTTLPDLIASRATPSAPAVGTLSYRDLAAAANRVAQALHARGVGLGEPVLVALPTSAELVAAFLGVLAAGALYVPVDPAAPAAQLAAAAARSGARLALTFPAAVDLPGTVETLPVETLPVDVAAGPDPGPPAVTVRPDDGALLLFASGSAGVVVTHRNAVAAAAALLTVFPAGSTHRADGPPLTAMLCVLAGGGTLHLDDQPVDYLHTTPARLAGSTPPRRAVVLNEPLLSQVDGPVVVLYGSAETGSVAIAGDGAAEPLPGVRVSVLDPWGAPVPPGCAGELWVGGPQVARGYLGAPGATAAAFGPDPAGGRRFRTGEQVRRLPDGRLEFPGPTAEPATATSATSAAAGPREPGTPLEEALLDGWQWLLPNRDFGVTDDFFDIGGDSILAIHAVAEARRHGLTLTVRQILDLRTIRALAAALDTVERADRTAPLGITGPTAVRIPAPSASPPTVPGVTIEGDVLTADPSQVDDWSLARAVRTLAAGKSTSDTGVLGVLVPRETMAALAGPAHEAYATTTTDLVVAATLAATGAAAVAVADTRREEPAATGAPAEPGLLRPGPATGDTELVQAVKAAMRAPEADDPAVPGVRVLPLPGGVPVTALGDAGTRVVVTLAGARLVVTGDADAGLAERVRDRLTGLVEHCTAAETVYSVADFPDAGLDDAAMAGLLAGLEQDLDPETAP